MRPQYRADRSFKWVLYLTGGLLFASAGLRAFLTYARDPALVEVLGFWLLALILFVLSETPLAAIRPGIFSLYVVLQTVTITLLLFVPGFPDFFAILFAILCTQIMQRWNTGTGILFIGVSALLMTWPLARMYGIAQGVSFGLLYTFVNVLLASYALGEKSAQAARVENMALSRELEQANLQLEDYARQVERLAIGRERHQLARELHDSVTQTIYSMTLGVQSTLLLLARDPARVGSQLERLNELAQSALVEMRALVSGPRPDPLAQGGLVAALSRYISSSAIPDGLTISLETDGDRALGSAEAKALYRIAQEALNNVTKHAQAARGFVRLHLDEPFWIEIQDQGCGYDPEHLSGSGVGLTNMRERAAEIGWTLEITTAPGAGTRVRVEKRQA